MFQHYCVILREIVVSTLPSYTSKSNVAVGNTIWNLKLFHIGVMLLKFQRLIRFKILKLSYLAHFLINRTILIF